MCYLTTLVPNVDNLSIHCFMMLMLAGSNIFQLKVMSGYKWLLYTGVFKPLETIFDIRQFVTSSLEREECPFSLSAYSKSLDDESMSIAQSGLVSYK